MTKKTNIAILGPGGVGGFTGARLARAYAASEDVEIIFFARGENEKAIREKGIRLITGNGEETGFPHLVTSAPAKAGPIDFLICTVKGYDLESSLRPLKDNIHEGTVILPLLNGVDAPDRIRALYPRAEVWEGCMYIVARLIAPGVVKENGHMHALYFGSPTAQAGKLLQMEKLLKDAGIHAHISDTIEQTIWEKFIFISGIASLTSFLNLPIGAIVKAPEHRETLLELIREAIAIARARHIDLPENLVQTTLSRMESLPYDTTSSMHSDFQKGGKTEYLSLTGYVVEQGKKTGIPTPAYNRILEDLAARIQATSQTGTP